MKWSPVIIMLVLALFVSACGPAVINTAPMASPIPPAALSMPDETPDPRVTVTATATPTTMPPPPIETPTPPIGYQQMEVEGGPSLEVWNIQDEETLMASAVPMVLVLVAVDGPLPIGDIFAIVVIAGVAYYLIASPVTDVGTLEWPQLPQVPPIDWEGIRHAAQQRFWPIMFAIIAYAAVSQSPDGMFYGPTSGRLLLTKQVSGWGVIALVFSAQPNLIPDATHIPIGTGLITIVYDPRSRTEKLRMSDCASWTVLPVIGFNPIFEPPPAGTGRCLTNNNVTP